MEQQHKQNGGRKMYQDRPELMTTTQLAERLSTEYEVLIHPAEVRLWIEAESFTVSRIGTYYVMEWTEVRDWFERVMFELVERIGKMQAERARVKKLVTTVADELAQKKVEALTA